jgi:hypothetical protein
MPEQRARQGVDRVELPHRYLERRIRSPELPLRLHGRQLTDGCLMVRPGNAQ